MSLETDIQELVEQKFLEKDWEDCFLVDLNIGQGGRKIEVFMDCDDGVTFKRCQKISRFIESHIDERSDVHSNYILEVSSPGANKPLKFLRQYPKHIGRKLKIKLTTGEEFEGNLIDVLENGIRVESRIVEKDGKRKIRKKIERDIDFKAIKHSKVKLSF